MFSKMKLFSTFAKQKNNGSVVQLYRTSDSGSEGRGLEPRRGYKFCNSGTDVPLFFCTVPQIRKHKNHKHNNICRKIYGYRTILHPHRNKPHREYKCSDNANN